MSPNKRQQKRAASAENAPTAQERRSIAVLLRVSEMVGGNLDLDAVLRSAMEVAAEAMNAEACSVLLEAKDRGAGDLRFHIVKGPSTTGLRDAGLQVDDQSIAGWVAKHGEALLVPEAYQDARFNRRYDQMTGFRTKSIICVPLRAKGKQVGVIQFLNRRDGRPFDEGDLEFSQAVAGLIAVAIYTAEEHQARLAAERLATVGQTLAGMAHCVKNILNGLWAGSYIIDQNFRGDEISPVARGWKIVKRNMQFLTNIVLDMLSYSKERKPLCQPCQINDLCQDVADLLQLQAGEKGVTVVNQPHGEIHEVCVEEAAIRRCLMNLVGNAIDACEKDKGVVRIESGPSDAAGCFSIRVSDNGCGMAPAVCEKIFDPFYSTKGGKGTGLGLAVTKKIVEEHRGTILVKSSAGAGTEFTLVLPLQPSDENRG